MIAGSFSQIAAETARDHGFGAWLLSGFGAVQGAPRMRAVSRVRRWRIIQAAERARQAIAHSAIGCAVSSGGTEESDHRARSRSIVDLAQPGRRPVFSPLARLRR